MNGHRYRWTDRQMDRKMGGQTDGLTALSWMDRQMDGQREKWTDKRMDRQMDGHTD